MDNCQLSVKPHLTLPSNLLLSNQLRHVLAEWLKGAMLQKNPATNKRWTRTDLATAADVSRQTIWTILEEKADPQDGTIEALARALGVTPPEVLTAQPGASRVAEEIRRPSAEGGADSAFVVGVRAMLETMRRQVEALGLLLPPAGEPGYLEGAEMLIKSLHRQVDALERLLLGRHGGPTMSSLIADMRDVGFAVDALGRPEEERRSGGDRREVG